MLKLFFASDVHGSDICWKKFLKVIDHFKVEIAILGGDLTGKMVIPVVRNDNKYSYSIFGRHVSLLAENLKEECVKIANAGYYPYPCEKEEVEQLSSGKLAQVELFDRLMVQRMQQWMNLASENFKGKSQLYVSPGNDDRLIVDEILEKSDSVVACEGKLNHLPDGYDMVTCGWVNPTPRKLPERCLTRNSSLC